MTNKNLLIAKIEAIFILILGFLDITIINLSIYYIIKYNNFYFSILIINLIFGIFLYYINQKINNDLFYNLSDFKIKNSKFFKKIITILYGQYIFVFDIARKKFAIKSLLLLNDLIKKFELDKKTKAENKEYNHFIEDLIKSEKKLKNFLFYVEINYNFVFFIFVLKFFILFLFSNFNKF